MNIDRIILVIGFLLVLIFPIVNGIIGFSENENTEKRSKQQVPKLELATLSSWMLAYDRYYKKNFPGRSLYFEGISSFKYDLLGTSVLPDKVIAGKDGFLFLGNSHNQIIDRLLGLQQFSEKELFQIQHKINGIDEWMNQQDIAFYIGIAPNKSSIYASALPFEIPENAVTEFDQLMVLKGIKAKITYLDPLPPASIQNNSPLFIKKNTHWNEIGAFHGYNQLISIINKDFPAIQPLKWKDYKVKKGFTQREDISLMLDLAIKDPKYHLRRTGKRIKHKKLPNILNKRTPRLEKRYRNQVNGNKLKVVVIRDSFTTSMESYFKDTFYETVFLWTGAINKRRIKAENPDIVIFEIVERDLEKILDW